MRVSNWLSSAKNRLVVHLNRSYRRRYFKHNKILEARLPGAFLSIVLACSVCLTTSDADDLFSTGVQYPVGNSPRSIITADFDGDGNLDLATGNRNPDEVSILLGSGTGAFAPPLNFSITSSNFNHGINDMAVGDFNGDGFVDLVTANGYDDSLSVLLGEGDGTFSAPLETTGNFVATSVLAEDFTGDGILDLATGTYSLFGGNGDFFLGNGDGTFEEIGPVLTSQYFSTADFDGDNLVDVFRAAPSNLSVLRNQGDGFFEIQQPPILILDFQIAQQSGVTTGDFNGDGLPDVASFVTEIYTQDDLVVSLGTDSGTFDSQIYPVGPATQILYFATVQLSKGDFNGDKIVDLIAQVRNTRLATFLGNGDGTFAEPLFQDAPGDAPYEPFTIGDFNNDGIDDIAGPNLFDDAVTVMLGILIGDVNQDGNVDLLDVAPFVQLVTSGQFQSQADINGDGSVDLLDVEPFVNIILSN